MKLISNTGFGTLSMFGGDKKLIQNLNLKCKREKLLGDLGIDGIKLKLTSWNGL
jgi:hypothetical protein